MYVIFTVSVGIANEHCSSLVCICVCVFVCGWGAYMCVHVQSHSPFTKGNDRERVQDPNWASGTLHTPPGIASTALLLIQTIRKDKRQGEWCFCVCVCVRVCVCVCVCVCVQLLNVTSTSAYASVVWKFQMNIAGHMFAFVHGCVCVCVWVGMCVCV